MFNDFIFCTSRVNQEPLDHLVNQAQQDLGYVSIDYDFSPVFVSIASDLSVYFCINSL